MPPWPVTVGLALLVIGRFATSRLSLIVPPLYESLVPTVLTVSLGVFWFWPPRGPEATEGGALSLRFVLITGVIYLVADWLLDLDAVAVALGRPPPCRAVIAGVAGFDLFRPRCAGLLWPTLARGYVPLYHAALVYPFARLFAQVRLDGGRTAQGVLGPCAMFFGFAVAVPAFVLRFDPEAPRYATWLLVGALLLSGSLIAYQLGRPGQPGSVTRRGLSLLWGSARLPFLFVAAELLVALLGVARSP